MEQQQRMPVTENWGTYITNFLKAADVDESQDYSVMSVEETEQGGEKKIRLHFPIRDDVFVFDLNKTNTVFLKESGIKSPKSIVGCRLKFKKVFVTNPSTKREVESLRIKEIIHRDNVQEAPTTAS